MMYQNDDNPCRPRHFKPAPCAPAALEGPVQQSLETSHTRLLVTGALLGLAFLVVALRLVQVTEIESAFRLPRNPVAEKTEALRAAITDTNGVLLATTLETPSLYADPRQIQDPQGVAHRLAEVLPDLVESEVAARLASDRGFVWIKRQLTPHQEVEINRLGIPGLQFQPEERRFYPLGNLAAHVVGYTGLDSHGLAGAERAFDDLLHGQDESVALTLDTRLQYILREEIARQIADFDAQGGMGIIMDVNNGDVLAMVSLPDFDPNDPLAAASDATFDRVTLGTYEMGSTFKIFTTAMALEAGTATLASSYDATEPLHVGRFWIHDDHPQRRWLTVPEILEYSSNIGAARMAVEAGTERQRDFLGRLGLLAQPSFELPEIAAPRLPSPWHDVNTMTVAFGHGISVSALQMATAVSAVVNGGVLYPATIVKHGPGYAPAGQQVLSAATSQEMRRLLRLVVEDGTGKLAVAPGYLLGGKTGTAEKVTGSRYDKKELLSSFIGVFPITAPRYLVMIAIDAPHPNKQSYGSATGGWVAAPGVGRVVERMAPLVGIPPVDEDSPEIRRSLVVESASPQGPKFAAN